MKKFLYILCAMLLTGAVSASAQIVHGSTYSSSTTYKVKAKTRYQGELNVGYGLSGKLNEDGETEDADYGRVFFETVHGMRINKYAFAGLGVGFQYATEWESAMLPIFVDLKGYYPVSDRFAPYVAVDLGYAIDLFDSPSEGFYASYGVGLNFGKLNFGLGWQHQSFSDYDASVNSFFVKIGLKF